MTESTDRSSARRVERATEEADSGAVEAVGTYDADGDTVFYDTENPLAWVQSTETVRLDEAV